MKPEFQYGYKYNLFPFDSNLEFINLIVLKFNNDRIMRHSFIFLVISICYLLSSCGGSEKRKPQTILLVIDGLASGSIDNIPLTHLRSWKKEGCYYKEVYVPLPAHPDKAHGYFWSCSISNPVMMTGTVFIGQDGIKNAMVQDMVPGRKSAFITNDDGYDDIAREYGLYLNLKNSEEDIYDDEIVFDKARKIIGDENPSFIRLHLKGAGAAGSQSDLLENKNEKWYHNIWQENSPYLRQLKKDDQLIEEFINWLQYKGYWGTTTFLLLGDHGQADTGGCPPYDPGSGKTELLILGKDVNVGAGYDYAEMTDIAPTITRINNLTSLRYSQGRILEEAFLWGKRTPSIKKEIKELNDFLILNRKTDNDSTLNGFLNIDRICDWHKVISPVAISGFLKYEQKKLIVNNEDLQ
jgi:hypothetical protein